MTSNGPSAAGAPGMQGRHGREPSDGADTSAFDARGLGFRYRSSPDDVLRDIRLSIPSGSLYGIVGPNGSGKSTLLRVLLGAVPPSRGEVRYQGRQVHTWSRRDLAREVGVVSQSEEGRFPVSVRETVAMGRYPHLGLWREERQADRRAIEAAMERCSVAELAGRSLYQISGGERQRVRIARALAQQPRALMLDEPTAALDVHYEMVIFELLAGLAREDGVTVAIVTHNLNLVARYADTLLLLHEGRSLAEGTPREVLRREHLESVYEWPLTVGRHPGPGRDTGAPQVTALASR